MAAVVKNGTGRIKFASEEQREMLRVLWHRQPMYAFGFALHAWGPDGGYPAVRGRGQATLKRLERRGFATWFGDAWWVTESGHAAMVDGFYAGPPRTAPRLR